jgi:hypothetical protein
MTETLGTELTRTSTQFFDITPEVDTTINPKPLTQQETEYFDAAETFSGNNDETTNTATPTTTSTVTQSFGIDTPSHVFRFQPSQPDSRMTGDGGRENDAAERPASAGDNDTVSHSFRFQQPNPNLEQPDSEMTEDGDNNMGYDGGNSGEDTPRAGTPYPDMDDMDPWAENMDQADGGESDIHEESEVRKRLRTSPFPFEDDEEFRAQSSKRFDVGFQ